MFFSQGELSRLSSPGQKNQVLRLIDASCGERLNELASREASIRGELEQLFAASRQAEALDKDVQRTRQELDELNRQWQARKDIQDDAHAHRQAQDAKRFIVGASSLSKGYAEGLRAALAALEPIPQLSEAAVEWPHHDWFEELYGKLKNARDALVEEVEAAVTRFSEESRASLERHPRWAEVSAGLNEAEQRFLAACEEKGVQPSDVSKLQEVDRLRGAKQNELEIKQKQLSSLHQ